MSASEEIEVVGEFPYEVEVVAHRGIVMPDGAVLSAKLWVPRAKAEGETFPAVIEAIPYRKDDLCLQDDSVRMAYVAGHGYLCVRLDLRGSGDSQGVLADEYCNQEQLDICAAIEQVAAMPECSGAVGMTGISWSGFNSL
ncbi:MAG: CocE/NonD family hydrolase, partial [Coriobacteriales bacterium]